MASDIQELQREAQHRPQTLSRSQQRLACREQPSREDMEKVAGLDSIPLASSNPAGTEQGSHSPQSPQKRTLVHDIALVFILCLAQVLLQASLSQSILPLEYIDESLGVTDHGQQSWLTAAFSLTVGTFILPAGIPFG